MELMQRMFKETHDLMVSGRTGEALFVLERLVVEGLNQLGLLYSDRLNSPDRADDCFRQASRIDPAEWTTCCNWAHVLYSHLRYADAEKVARRSVSLADDFASLFNYSVILYSLGKLDEAAVYCRQAVAKNPDHAAARFNYASVLLASGDYDEGWRQYEYRKRNRPEIQSFCGRFAANPWDGSGLRGKSVCVYSEQGVGDLVQFARFLPLLTKEGASRVVAEVQEAAVSLVRANFPELDEVVGRPDADYPGPPEADVSVSVCSLPFHFGIGASDISGGPYLKAEAAELEDDGRLKVGICWAGNRNHPLDWMRTCPLRLFAPLAELKHVRLFAVQKDSWPVRQWRGQTVDLRQGAENLPYVDLSPKLATFLDTAAHIAALDLVVTVDSAVAHLAGAMGKETWLLVPLSPDWRWAHAGDRTSWYSSVRLFRQQAFDWTPVFEVVVKELASRSVQKGRGRVSNRGGKTGSSRSRPRTRSTSPRKNSRG